MSYAYFLGSRTNRRRSAAKRCFCGNIRAGRFCVPCLNRLPTDLTDELARVEKIAGSPEWLRVLASAENWLRANPK